MQSHKSKMISNRSFLYEKKKETVGLTGYWFYLRFIFFVYTYIFSVSISLILILWMNKSPRNICHPFFFSSIIFFFVAINMWHWVINHFFSFHVLCFCDCVSLIEDAIKVCCFSAVLLLLQFAHYFVRLKTKSKAKTKKTR